MKIFKTAAISNFQCAKLQQEFITDHDPLHFVTVKRNLKYNLIEPT